jgi:hypothetical protein
VAEGAAYVRIQRNMMSNAVQEKCMLRVWEKTKYKLLKNMTL